MNDQQKAVALANLDRMWAEARQHWEDINIIAAHGLPEPDDAGAAAHQDTLVKLLACLVAAELGMREMGGP